MKLIINGVTESVSDGLTIEGLLRTLGLSTGATVVERNGAIVAREAYGNTVLTENDVLELVRVVGGG